MLWIARLDRYIEQELRTNILTIVYRMNSSLSKYHIRVVPSEE